MVCEHLHKVLEQKGILSYNGSDLNEHNGG